jgi:hypothetical protein
MFGGHGGATAHPKQQQPDRSPAKPKRSGVEVPWVMEMHGVCSLAKAAVYAAAAHKETKDLCGFIFL